MYLKTLLCAGATLLALAGGVEANTRLIASCLFPPQHFVCQDVLKQWGEEVERVTDRRVRVNMTAKSMAPAPEQLASIQGRVFDVGIQFNGFIANEKPGLGISLIPFLNGDDIRANSLAFWRTYQAYAAQSETFDGAKLLGVFTAGGADLYSLSDEPITSVEDLKSRKMWALPGVPATLLKELGTPVVSGPAVQMTEIIQRGVVSGFLGVPVSDALAFNVAPYAKSLTRLEAKIFVPSFSFFINEDAWNEIEAEDRERIMEISGEAFVERASAAWVEAESAALEKIAGETEILPAEAEFVAALEKAAEGFREAWRKQAQEAGIDADAAVEAYRKAVEELSR